MRMPALLLPAALSLMVPAPVQADAQARDQFVASNMIATFYHEFGHALVDLLGIPVLGREEDAVDALATLLIDLLWEPEDAAILVAEIAYGYALHIAHAEAFDDFAWWGEHALDEQRLAAMVCQFFGADPDARAELARELGMPDEVADSCIMTHAQITDSWLVFLEDLAEAPRTHGLELVEPVADPVLAEILAEEIALINDLFGLPETVEVSVESCGEANAFYDPAQLRIIMCTEFAEWYADAWNAATD